VEKPEGKRRLGKPRSGCENNIKMGLQEVGWRRRARTGLILLRIQKNVGLL
jgi:hypothetical protein